MLCWHLCGLTTGKGTCLVGDMKLPQSLFIWIFLSSQLNTCIQPQDNIILLLHMLNKKLVLSGPPGFEMNFVQNSGYLSFITAASFHSLWCCVVVKQERSQALPCVSCQTGWIRRWNREKMLMTSDMTSLWLRLYQRAGRGVIFCSLMDDWMASIKYNFFKSLILQSPFKQRGYS